MKTLIVYDSFFGNTRQIAETIYNALDSKDNVRITQASDVEPGQLAGLEFLIVGSPTRKFKPTEAITKFLNNIPANSLKEVKVLAFDTRISTKDINSRVLNTFVKIFGYAAEPIGDKLKQEGGELLLPPEGFIVKDSEGPLKEGELERAANWLKQAITQ